MSEPERIYTHEARREEKMKPIAWCWTCRTMVWDARFRECPKALPLYTQEDFKAHEGHDIDQPKGFDYSGEPERKE